ncbi:hypothetical protein CAPTEDRAFT_192230 [Capitella teleta]|uniref:RBD domain-containing protein n=1 Tax=Capitella teleta TaxID=283909 RepID=R7UEI8_CAPTE|nr:hypothetical protein CAPTEDRAFT_192230 [Capitella teleta]|eukprot:ELU04491.1 hypothetical protein CAPTEDRAFT_192230 [Capitella teleta]
MSTSSAAESLASSADCPETPDVLEMTLILPDGHEKEISVQSNKQMMDLLIQLAATHKLSPAGHVLQAYDPDTGRPIQYKASQSIGSLGVNVLHLASKRPVSNSEPKKPVVTSQRPFDVTHRVTVNLPRNQKHVLRVKPSLTLAQIFHQTCDEKNLDPYKYELQHPTDPRATLNMADPLLVYAPLAELTLVSISDAFKVLKSAT